MTDQRTVRIYCRGEPATATLVDGHRLERGHSAWYCDSCGNRLRRVWVWDDFRRAAQRKANDRSVRR